MERNFKMELKSINKFAKYQEKIEKKIERLKSKIGTNEEEITELKREYSLLFGEDQDTSKVAAKLSKLIEQTNVLKTELDIVENADYRQTELAKEVYEQYQDKKVEARKYLSGLWKEAERIKDEATAQIEELEKEYNSFSHDFDVEVVRGQFRPVINSLDFDENHTEHLWTEVERTFQLGTWPNITLVIQRGR